MSAFEVTAEWDWVDTPTGERLHHLASLDDPELTDSEWQGTGRTTCGLRSTFRIPGLMSRMGVDRCARCCDRLGIARGVGSPKNDAELRPWVEKRVARMGAK